jgi:hypothetical protein
MKCYYIPNEDAVGICKSCGKGISRGYTVDLGRGLACKDRCEEDVRALIRLIDNSISVSNPSTEVFRRSGKVWFGQALFLGAAGVFFAGFGVYRGLDPFTTGLGAIFIIYSVFVFLRARRLSLLVREKKA